MEAPCATALGASRASEPVRYADRTMTTVIIDNVSKVYGVAGNSTHALDDISLRVAEGEFVCLLGASGCGKSTLLNLVAGLDRPSAGSITVGAAGHEARTALMFQEAALFPWLTARGNVELPLKVRKLPRRNGGPRRWSYWSW